MNRLWFCILGRNITEVRDAVFFLVRNIRKCLMFCFLVMLTFITLLIWSMLCFFTVKLNILYFY